MSKRIRLNGPSQNTLEVEGQTIHGGQTTTVSDEAALELATASYIDVEILSDVPAPAPPPAPLPMAAGGLVSGDVLPAGPESIEIPQKLWPLSYAELVELAQKLGVEDIDTLATKTAVIAAIKEQE